MNFEYIEKIVKLFERNQSLNKPLELNINEDLLKILPLQRKFLLTLLRQSPISNFSCLSQDETVLVFQNQLFLCEIDQKQSGSCPSTCSKLHLCEKYLLNTDCEQIRQTGQCSYAHSLATKHNERILSNANLSSSDDQTLSLISSLAKLSLKTPPKTNFNHPGLALGRGRLKPENNSISNQSKFRLSRRLTVQDHSTNSKIDYKYSKAFNSDEINYLLGPLRNSIVEKDQCEIVSHLIFNFCRVKTVEEGKQIEDDLNSLLSQSLQSIDLPIDERLSLIINSSAALSILQQNRSFCILTEPKPMTINIQLIESSSTNCPSIDVICGDITQVPVDMMVCISTSNNLRLNVLHCAGPTIENEYRRLHASNDALLLDGGSTKAKKILFVPWETQIDQLDFDNIQKSLADLVKWSIEQAQQRNFQSISFPPIGTGQLGLDPGFVCEVMISSARECLKQSKIEVLFVIYPLTDDAEGDECYQIFRIYLESLSQQAQNRLIQKQIQSKTIRLLFDSAKIKPNPKSLIDSLENLIIEKTFPFSLIDPVHLKKIDELIELCLKWNVKPELDYSREELKLIGDRQSCSLCFYLLKQKNDGICQYFYEINSNEVHQLNPFICLNIDLALAFQEKNISIEENEQLVYHFDLVRFQMKMNQQNQLFSLKKSKFKENPSLPIVSTNSIDQSQWKSLKCFQDFQQTMSNTDWIIERIESIDNCLLKTHFKEHENEKMETFYYNCDCSSIQSIIFFGLHWTNTYSNEIYLSKNIFESHLHSKKFSIDGKFYLFAVQIAKNNDEKDFLLLKTDDISLTLPVHLIVYRANI